MKISIKDLTLEQKLKLLTGKDFWQIDNSSGKIPRFFMSDGPNGLRKIKEKDGLAQSGTETGTVTATAMPTLSLVANTWNEDLARLDSTTIADECIENDVQVLLAPGVNIKRTPLNGRNFEYISEDPIVAGRMGKAFIEGAQNKGVGTSLKHYCVNNRERYRFDQSSEVDERTLREIYLLPFEIATKAKPWTVMCSYNPINGVFASENKYLLNDVLRDEFGYDGVIVSDWGAVASRYKALKASLDLQMPFHKDSYDNLKNALDKGLITEQDIDKSVARILALIEKSEKAKDIRKVEWSKCERHENGVKIAQEGIVLLKNDGALPITRGKALVCTPNGFAPRCSGSGSAKVQTDYKPKALWQLLSDINGDDVKYDWAGYMRDAYEKAIHNDTIVISVDADEEGEAFDRERITIGTRSLQVIKAIAPLRELGKKVVVLVYAGSAVDMSEWIDSVDAVVFCGLGGECIDEALAPILAGKVSPSGKLTETFPLSLEDTFCGSDYGDGYVEEYTDRVFVGYRYYEKYGKKVLFPFGHGLSYANFEYSNLKVEKMSETDYQVSYDITNKSDIDAKEVSQIYVRDFNAMVARPIKELKNFSKDLIKAGQTKTVTLTLDYRSFAYYSPVYKRWQVENGAFEIIVGSSSQDLRLSKIIDIELSDDTQNSQWIVYC